MVYICYPYTLGTAQCTLRGEGPLSEVAPGPGPSAAVWRVTRGKWHVRVPFTGKGPARGCATLVCFFSKAACQCRPGALLTH